MKKQIHEMTPEELGQLFPVVLSLPDEGWEHEFRKEKAALEKVIGKDVIRIEHIGSTAIPGIKAKPTIDLLVEIKDTADVEAIIRQMKLAGYEYSEQLGNPAPYMMFMKGYTPEGFRGQAVHVHVRYLGDWDEIYFRDYLRSHGDTARKYEQIKVELQKTHQYNREEYANGKTDFVRKISGLARKERKEKIK